jgi:(p)ppGpp synthase/HD superfamily hydrolase
MNEVTGMQPDWVKQLSRMKLAPYICKARALIGVPRIGGDNMFRHQMMTLTVLLDYLVIDSVLLKAAIIHDIAEDACGMPGLSRNEMLDIDSEGGQVYDLMIEVTRRVDENGRKEPKSRYLRRIMESGSSRAKVLKLADRISNLISLGWVHDREFVGKTLAETREHILPHAQAINADMDRELRDLILIRERSLPLIDDFTASPRSEAISERAR